MAVDLVAFGPHPDDIEIGLGATIARHTDAGYRVGLCDLTTGELSSNGTPEQRRAEADAAARVLGVAWRENLGWTDGGIVRTRLTAATFRQLIESRDAQFGALAGVAFAEGVVVKEPVQRGTLLKHAP